jgi:hypothetical protein
MTRSRYTYEQLVHLVGGDHELIARLIEEGEIERHGDDVAVVDVHRVLTVRTLVRELEVDWSGVEIILRLLDQLASARRRIAELEDDEH